MRIDLSGRIALVTGASRGIGRVIAERLAAAGATVCLNYRARHELAKEALLAVEEAGGLAFLHQADVGDRSQATELVQAVIARCGRLDILVNNAGIVSDGLFVDLSDDQWSSVMDTNLNAAFHCARLAARQMLAQRWGRIINVSSVVVARGGRGQVNYAASKGGLNALTRALAVEVAARGVTVNAIAPGLIDTDMSRPYLDMAMKPRDFIPMRRPGTPAEVAALAVFLAGEDASYITGQIIGVDGGLT